MIDAVDTTLNQRPEALNAVCVDITSNIDRGQVIDSFVPETELSNPVVTMEFVSANGGTGGFNGGVAMKKYLLTLEGHRPNNG